MRFSAVRVRQNAALVRGATQVDFVAYRPRMPPQDGSLTESVPAHSERKQNPASLAKSSLPSSSRLPASSESSALFKPTPLPRRPRKDDDGIDEHEYRLRIGRAIHLLRATLPEFMRLGLVDYDGEGSSPSSSSPLRLDALSLSSLPGLSMLGLASASNNRKSGYKGKERERDAGLGDGVLSVYHPSVSFHFRPPVSHLSGGPSLAFSGRTLYLASAQVLRHALSALFSDANVVLDRMQLVGASGSGSSTGSAGPAGLGKDEGRGDDLLVKLRFEGINRMTGAPHDYTVVFRYSFDPASGQIIRHSVESVQPAPGRKVWAGLSTAWERLAGALGPRHGHPQGASSHSPCHNSVAAPLLSGHQDTKRSDASVSSAQPCNAATDVGDEAARTRTFQLCGMNGDELVQWVLGLGARSAEAVPVPLPARVGTPRAKHGRRRDD